MRLFCTSCAVFPELLNQGRSLPLPASHLHVMDSSDSHLSATPANPLEPLVFAFIFIKYFSTCDSISRFILNFYNLYVVVDLICAKSNKYIKGYYSSKQNNINILSSVKQFSRVLCHTCAPLTGHIICRGTRCLREQASHCDTCHATGVRTCNSPGHSSL